MIDLPFGGLQLKRLWLACALLTSLALLTIPFSCRQGKRHPHAATTTTESPVIRQEPLAAAPSYTYIGRTTLPKPPAAPLPEKHASPPTPEPSQPPGSSSAVRAESTHAAIANSRPEAFPSPDLRKLGLQEAVKPDSGAIPDLDLDVSQADLMAIARRYGYLPAIKNRDRLLGKIDGLDAPASRRFMPISSQELSRYASRGRSGSRFPQARSWLERVAAELEQPVDELSLIFLVPLETEALFIRAEHLALTATGKPANEVLLVRGHFEPDLTLVIDELVTTSEERLPVNSVRLDAP